MISRVLAIAFLFLAPTAGVFGGEQTIEVFAASPYDRYTIYQALIFFWIGIAGLIVIIIMKLREVKRIQNMDIDGEEKDAPFLD